MVIRDARQPYIIRHIIIHMYYVVHTTSLPAAATAAEDTVRVRAETQPNVWKEWMQPA
jgi:hypothetical protein